MKLLILGGPKFLGRACIDAALAAGHELTLFNRGQTFADAYPEVERITGDRDGGLGALAGRRWDAVLDTCGYVPRIVRASAEALADATDHYTFVSTISVYGNIREAGVDESAPVATTPDETVEEITGETYGPLKALCERAVTEVFGDRAFVPRPGLIVGPWDPSNRFTYWVTRVARGGRVLCPGPAERPIQVIDVRDLAAWMLRGIEARLSGLYNATGPIPPHTFGQVLDTCRTVSGSDARWAWTDDAFLVDQKVGPWMELPLWIPGDEEAGLMEMDISAATAKGMTQRPLEETVRDTLVWAKKHPAPEDCPAGMKPARELELLSMLEG